MAAAASRRLSTLSPMRAAVTAAGVGVAAGTIGTWFEMSHGVICIPVLTLPPLGLTQQVAAGSTVVGVAVREFLSATLYGLDPAVDFNDQDQMEDLVDISALIGISSAGTVAAFAAAAASARVSMKYTRKANGVFCLGLALFLQWRESQMRAAKQHVEDESHRLEAPGAEPQVRPQVVEASGFRPSMASMLPPPKEAPPQLGSTGLTSDWARLTVLGVAAGSVLGFFGIGTAWMLAPIMRHTAPGSSLPSGAGTQWGELDLALSEPFGVDARTRRTACLAMVLPSMAAAYQHFSLGHVPMLGAVAVPLALGAIFGSAMAGTFLEDVPADEELKTGLAGLLFCYGVWNVFKP